MTTGEAGDDTTVNFVKIASEDSVPPSEDAQSLKYFCSEVCACPDVSRVRGCGKSKIREVDTKFVRLGK
jgi:hypothetical protein